MAKQIIDQTLLDKHMRFALQIMFDRLTRFHVLGKVCGETSKTFSACRKQNMFDEQSFVI